MTTSFRSRVRGIRPIPIVLDVAIAIQFLVLFQLYANGPSGGILLRLLLATGVLIGLYFILDGFGAMQKWKRPRVQSQRPKPSGRPP